MRVTLSVNGPDDAGLGEVRDLRRWLQRDPALRGCLQREPAPVPQPGSMGAAGELVPLLLAPGGLTAALAAAVVAWLQNRRGDQTVTITLPDGTEVAVSATKVRGQTAETAGELAQRIAAAIDRPAGDRPAADRPAADRPATDRPGVEPPAPGDQPLRPPAAERPAAGTPAAGAADRG